MSEQGSQTKRTSVPRTIQNNGKRMFPNLVRLGLMGQRSSDYQLKDTVESIQDHGSTNHFVVSSTTTLPYKIY